MLKLLRVSALIFLALTVLSLNAYASHSCSTEYYTCADQAQMAQYDCEDLGRTNCTTVYNAAMQSCWDQHCTVRQTEGYCCGTTYSCGPSGIMMFCCTQWCY